MTIRISKIFVSDAFVEYKEKNHITRKSGKVQFYHTNATISNFTNDKSSIAANNIMTADVRTVFLNMTPLTTSWIFYLGHPSGKFGVKGSLGSIDATKLNVLAEPMGPARIEKGKLNGLQFDLTGNDYSMNARVRCLYNDVKVSILEMDKGAKETDRKFLASLLANTVIKNDNPKGKDPPRDANIEYKRDTNRSLFNLCWKSIFEGVRETLGIK